MHPGLEGYFVEVPPLARTTAEDIMSQWMQQTSRRLTAEQLAVLLEQFTQEPQPLFLQLCYGQASHWRSYTPPTHWLLGNTVQSAIDKLLSDLENQHGKILVSKALGTLQDSVTWNCII